jgi:hypothetical protein
MSPLKQIPIQLINYQTNMERIIQWVLKLENQLDREEKIATKDLKTVKDQFQKHEVKKDIFIILD